MALGGLSPQQSLQQLLAAERPGWKVEVAYELDLLSLTGRHHRHISDLLLQRGEPKRRLIVQN